MKDLSAYGQHAPAIAALRAGALLAISVSGGKDSQAMMAHLMQHEDRANWPGRVVAVHADLGRAEWKHTPAFVEQMCEAYGVDLMVCQNAKGDLITRMERRRDDLAGTGRPFWPSSSARYCTAELKRNPIDTLLRSLSGATGLVVSAEGVRRSESVARSKKPAVNLRSQLTGKAVRMATAGEDGHGAKCEAALNTWAAPVVGKGARLALDWRPIIDMEDADVWEAIGHTEGELEARRELYAIGEEETALEEWTAHPAYVFGNQRLSCALCVLACKSDLVNGARHNPETFRHLVQMEAETGFTFKDGMALADIAEEAGVDISTVVA